VKTNWASLACILLALAVLAGAFGAHVLDPFLDTRSKEIFNKAVFYHFVHALGILIISQNPERFMRNQKFGNFGLKLLFFGIIIFCGSLYSLALTGLKWLGAITPFGGIAFILGWFSLAKAAWRVD